MRSPEPAVPVTLEGFVARLHDDGLEAGRREAELLRQEARAQAGQIIQRAEHEAARILTAAEEGAATSLARGRAELRFAVRDAVLELRAALGTALDALLRESTTATLRDPAFLGGLIRGMVADCTGPDAAGGALEIRVPQEMLEELEAWSARELGAGLLGDGTCRVRATLTQAGFELHRDGAGVEVTTDAVVEKLTELVSPRLRELFAAAEAGVLEGAAAEGAPAA